MKNKIKSLLLLTVPLFLALQASAQTDLCREDYLKQFNKKQFEKVLLNYYSVRDYFEEAYQLYPSVPRGILEAVAFQYSRFSTYECRANEHDSHGMPVAHTIMGLTVDGKGVFRENCKLVSKLSGYSTSELVTSNRLAVIGYAKAFHKLQEKYGCFSDSIEEYTTILIDLCELPLYKNNKKDFALNSFLYMVYFFLDDERATEYGIPPRKIDFEKIFGEELDKLRAPSVEIGVSKMQSGTEGSDYYGAIFNQAPSCNYTKGRGGKTVSSVTIHYTQGSYAGTIAWFKNCSSNVSSHYIIRSADGQVTQMVKEEDKAWHAGAVNGYTIGIEHEAMGDIASYFTAEMYSSSAELVRDICSRRGISTHRVFYRDTLDDGTVLNDGVHSLGGETACTQIRGHQHYPSQTHTDPGKYWNWNLYYKLLNPSTQTTEYNDTIGQFTDSGGLYGDYGDDERKLFLINVPNADSITLNFSSFELEPNYDFIWIYDGNSVFSPLIGRWNTSSPGTITAKGSSMLVEFRSDCATTASGWNANWTAHFGDGNQSGTQGTGDSDGDNNDLTNDEELPDDNDAPSNDSSNPTTNINHDVSNWITKDYTAEFSDGDDVGLKWRFFQIMESDGNVWGADPTAGFLCDNFDASLNLAIWVNNYTNPWKIQGGALCQTNTNAEYSGVAARLNGSVHQVYLYDFYLKFNSDGKCSFVFNCNNAPSLSQYYSGYEICFDKSNRTITLYRLILGARRLLKKVCNIAFIDNTNYFYRIVFDNTTGEILLKRHANTIFKVTDEDVLATTPYSYIGFFTNTSSVVIDNLRVYGSRNGDVFVSVGAPDTCMMRTQAYNGAGRTKLKSVVVDKAYKFSTLAEKLLKVDYTPPSKVENLRIKTENVTLSNGTTVCFIDAQWDASADNQSGIEGYYHLNTAYPLIYSSNWNNNGKILYCNHCYATPVNIINFSVTAENKAGLRSEPTTYSIAKPTATKLKADSYATVTPHGSKVLISVDNPTHSDANHRYSLYDLTGREILNDEFVGEVTINAGGIAKGVYIVKIYRGKILCETKKVALVR